VTLDNRIEVLHSLGEYIHQELNGALVPVKEQAIIENLWFTEEGINQALSAVAEKFLNRDVLIGWAKQYNIPNKESKKVGLVLAGNIPMVGLHDVISVFLSGHKAVIKYSSKDKVLISYLIDRMGQIDASSAIYFEEVEFLKNMDGVIATGGETASTHFEYYFSKYPHIIRKNRSSVAIITPEDGSAELQLLGKDIFTYYGLGCRSISKMYIPQGYNLDTFFESIIDYGHVLNHNKYKNNYDYSNAIYLLGNHTFLTNNFLIIREEESISSRIACVHYEYYSDLNTLAHTLQDKMDDLQCIASSYPIEGLPHTALGTCQSPAIDDYADHVDTMDFLIQLYE